MMRKLLSALLLVFIVSGLALAQDNELTPYEIALQRIEEARVNKSFQLYLTDLGLETLPPEIGYLDELVELRIDNNNLSLLPPEIGQLASLRRLFVQNNQLSLLPTEIGNLSKLESLHLGYNQLNAIPRSLGNLINLQVLTLEDNLLSSLPEEISQLSNLCYLDISHNQIQILPNGIGQLTNLTQSFYEQPRDCLYMGMGVGFKFDNNPLISPPQEAIEQGTAATLEYLLNEAWWHLQRLIAGGASFVGIVALGILGLRWKNRRGKSKNEEMA